MIDFSLLPKNPGCYLFKNKDGKIIYVGKAKDLKKRVSSYFQKTLTDEKTIQLVKRISSIDFIVTSTEVEALILENNLIKKHFPRYNIMLKDSKRYAYIALTKEDFPRIIISREKKDNLECFGPFVSGLEREYVLKLLKQIFKLRTCKKMPKRPCLRFHIGLCKAPCINNISKKDYQNIISKVRYVLKGNISELISILESEMKIHSNDVHFEKAIELREQIRSLTYLSEKQNMERKKVYDEDIINYVIRDDKIYLAVFNIYKGTLLNKEEFVFDRVPEFLTEFILQYYSEKHPPKEVIVPVQIDKSLNSLFSKTKFIVPKIGDKKSLLNLVLKNIELSFFGNSMLLEELKKSLRLNDTPYVIECFDISHISGSAMVGSMVSFKDAEPDKSNYRRFKIRTVEGIDDFKAISEIVRRRYSRLLSEGKLLPNLVIIDGGKGQLKSALASLNELNIHIPIISIAKRFEEIYVPGLKIPLKVSGKSLQLIRRIRDEAHRFAITYNRLLRRKESGI